MAEDPEAVASVDRAALDRIELGERVAVALRNVGERREFHMAGITISGRRRRPSGEREPLPRMLQASERFWLLIGILVGLVWVSVLAWSETTGWWFERDHEVLFWFADRRTDTLTAIMRDLHALGSEWTIRLLRWGTILVLIGFRRWRHLFGVLGVILVLEWIGAHMVLEISRVRPFVEIIGDWKGFSHPSLPMAALPITLVVMGYALIPKGRWRSRWFILSGVLVAALLVARIYLGVDHPSDGVVAVVLGVAISVVGFRLFVPGSVFPVTYRRGPSAHLDVGGARGRAIRQAVQEQLGIEVLAIEPVGLESSAGSTPLRLQVAVGPDRYLFAKLYASNHLRSDRWYKLGRTLRFGALEDEVRFGSVRHLVEYEDYMLRVMRDAGLSSAQPHGFAEIISEREYIIVTEFIEGGQEIDVAEVDDSVIDDAFRVVRQLWDAGLAHRDIKPANVMVRDGQVLLIDVAFATVRPTPWRQAVDLANMMLILALRTDPRRVYERALGWFAAEDIGEACAASHGVTIPSQLQAALRELEAATGRNLVAELRALAPECDPIHIQRWSTHRVVLAAGTLITAVLFTLLLIANLEGAGFL